MVKEFSLKSLNILLSFGLIFNITFINTARANVSHVTPDGSTNTTIDTTPNNITIVNIADPNSNGVSMNNFTDYNVDPTGLIINNSNINYDTHLAGWISANTHISNGSNHQASLIVGQVTGNLPSYLLGYTEIAGGKADLVLLNQNGIACNGCGFININSMFLGTGIASFQSGMLTGINTNNNGNISVTGSGLDGTSLSSLSLISKQINLNATTNLGNTGTLILQQGTGSFNFINQQFTTASTTQSNNIAIDASHFGSMYAGKIFIIANDLGVGVHLEADVIAQRDGITILDTGEIVFGKVVASKTDLNITAGTIINKENSILFSQNNTTLNADNITNLSLILARNNININATTLNNGSTSQAAYITAGNDMQIVAGQINNIGHDNQSLIEGQAYTVTTEYPPTNIYVNSPPQITSQEVVTNMLTSANSRIIANHNLIIQGNLLNQTGDVLAGNNMTIIGNVTNNITHYTTRPLAANWVHRYKDSCTLGFCHVQWDYWTTYTPQDLSSTTPSRVAAGNNLIFISNQTQNDRGNGTFQDHTPLTQNISSNPNNNYASTFTNAANLNLANPNSPVLDLSSLANTGMFINNVNPPVLTTTNLSGTVINFTYQTETNPIFIDPNTFLSSQWFLSHLNFSPGRQIILVGDPTYERQLIHDAIAKAGMAQYLSNSSEDDLYENGLSWLQANQTNPNYTFGNALTSDQINSLTTDMVIPVYQTINGQQVLVPQVYFCNKTLAKNSQQNSTGGQIYSTNGAVTMIATGSDAVINNSGYISANNKVNIISQGSFVNNGGTINSTNGDIDINAQSVLITNQSQTNAVTEKENNLFSLLFGGNSGATTKQVGTSTQIQNVSKLTANNINITSSDNLNIQSAYLHALNNVSLTSTNGSINLTQNSSTANADHTSDITNYSSQTVANVIETGSTDSTFLLIQKQHNNQQLAQLKIQLSGGKDVKSQIDQLTQANTQIDQQLKTNANQGSITINSAKDVNILASQNITNNHSSYNKTNMMYSIHDNHDLQIATTVSPLLSSNNITISADNNINLLSSILVGQGNLNLTSTNGNVNMQSLQDLYYQYDFSQATSMNLGALLGMLLAAVVIGAVTGGVGALALGAIGAATVSVGTAVVGAAIASSVGVGLQLGITAAIDHQNGGAAATKAMQSGHMDSTTKQYSSNVGSSLLFGGNVSASSGNTSIDTATSISSFNLNQTANNRESASFKEEHKTVGPDWNQLMTDAAINGVVSGVTVAAGPLIEAGLSKLGSFVSKSFGFTDEATEFATHGLTKSQFDDLALRQGINKSNNVGLRLGNGMGDDVSEVVAGNWSRGSLNTGRFPAVGDLANKYTDIGYHAQYVLDDGTNIGRGAKGIMINDTRPYVINSQYYDDAKMVPIIINNHYTMPKYNICGANCQDLQKLSEIEYLYGSKGLDPVLLINSIK